MCRKLDLFPSSGYRKKYGDVELLGYVYLNSWMLLVEEETGTCDSV